MADEVLVDAFVDSEFCWSLLKLVVENEFRLVMTSFEKAWLSSLVSLDEPSSFWLMNDLIEVFFELMLVVVVGFVKEDILSRDHDELDLNRPRPALRFSVFLAVLAKSAEASLLLFENIDRIWLVVDVDLWAKLENVLAKLDKSSDARLPLRSSIMLLVLGSFLFMFDSFFVSNFFRSFDSFKFIYVFLC